MYEPITHCQLHRIFRVGVCPVLEVTVTYPCLGDNGPEEELSFAVARFNRAYLRMAEGVMTWSSGALLESAESAFRDAGAAAAFRFDRRVVDCRMTAECGGDGKPLFVTRALSLGSRRGEIPTVTREETDCWRCPELTLFSPRKKGRRICK